VDVLKKYLKVSISQCNLKGVTSNCKLSNGISRGSCNYNSLYTPRKLRIVAHVLTRRLSNQQSKEIINVKAKEPSKSETSIQEKFSLL